MKSENESGRSVQIHMLTVGEYNLTGFLFSQLTEEPLIAEDGRSLNGKPWGRVNYHPEGCGSADSMQDHCHVVWQLGDELRRSVVSFDYQRVFESSLADTLYDLCVEQSLDSSYSSLPPQPGTYVRDLSWNGRGIFDRELDRWTNKSRGEWLSSRRSFTYPCQNHPDLQCRASMSDKAEKAVEAWGNKPGEWAHKRRFRTPSTDSQFTAWYLAHAELISSLKDKSFDDIKARYSVEQTAEAERQQRQRDRRAEIAALPQLFLAS